MSDPFQEKHARDARSAEKAAKDAAAKQTTQNTQARLAAQQKAAQRPANWDIGYPWPKKFYDPSA